MKRLEYLTPDEVEAAHQATLQILFEVGVKLTHPTARDLLTSHGASLAGNRVLFPPDLVMDCLGKCPPIVRLAGRDPQKAIELGTGEQYAHNTGGVPNCYEAATRQRRPAVRQDNIESTRLADQLLHCNAVTTTYTPQDVPPVSMQIWALYDTLANTTKPVLGPGAQTPAELRVIAEMSQIACPDTPLTYHCQAISTISPLFFPDETVEAIMETARLGFSYSPLPAPTIGATAPLSLAGALVQQNAEILAAIVLVGLIHPGLPIVYSGRLGIMDPRSGASASGNPETGIISAATVQLGHYYNLPVDVYGLTSDAVLFDFQSGYERMANGLVPYLAGADIISGIGDMESGMAGSLVQMALDNELVAYIRRVKRGFTIDADSLAVDVIRSVAASEQGNYLAEMHSVRYLRAGELFVPKLALHQKWAESEAAGQRDIVNQAQAQAQKLLAEYDAPPLDEAQQKGIEALIRAYENEMGA